jgi:hypothetical protein
MNWPLLIPLLATALVAILGWFAAHRLTEARDQANKRREMRLTLLLGAYRALESATNRDFSGEVAQAACKAFADIQLVGTAEQVKLAQTLMYEFGRTQGGDWQPLLLSLREDLRAELGLRALDSQLVHLRWTDFPKNLWPEVEPGGASISPVPSLPLKNPNGLERERSS